MTVIVKQNIFYPLCRRTKLNFLNYTKYNCSTHRGRIARKQISRSKYFLKKHPQDVFRHCLYLNDNRYNDKRK